MRAKHRGVTTGGTAGGELNRGSTHYRLNSWERAKEGVLTTGGTAGRELKREYSLQAEQLGES